MKIRIFGRSDVGCVRDSNEDMILVGITPVRDADICVEKDITTEDRFCVLVSDGMGGHDNGEVASEHTLVQIRAAIMNKSADWSNMEENFSATVCEIGAQLDAMSVEQGVSKSMGCTLTGIIFLDGKVYLVNVGDSRTYRYRDGFIRQMTVDQTLHERDGVDFPMGKALYSCIGANCMPDAAVEEIGERIIDGDRFIICSDGLTDMVSEEEIESMLASGDPESTGNSLVEAARAAGGKDNISVIVLDFVAEETVTEEPEPQTEVVEALEAVEMVDTVDSDIKLRLERIIEIANKVIHSGENNMALHRNIPLVKQAFEDFKALPDSVEGEFTKYEKICYLDQLADNLNEYECPRFLISLREYQLSLFESISPEETGNLKPEDIEEELQKLRDYIDESISVEEFCQKYHKSLKFDPVERSEKWEEVIYEASEKAIQECGEPGHMGYCFGYWSALSAALAEYGIDWRSPARMNPRVMFD